MTDEEGYYWEVTNMVTGEILQLGTRFDSIHEATKHAKEFLRKGYQHFGNDHLVIKVFTQSPEERTDPVYVTYTPVHTESYWLESSETEQRPVEGGTTVMDMTQRIGLMPHVWDMKILTIGKKPLWYEGGTPVAVHKFLASTYGDASFSPNEAANLLVYEGQIDNKHYAIQAIDALIVDGNIHVSLSQTSESVQAAGHRPFPQTYGDWVDLAENVKEKAPDPWTQGVVNNLLQTISEGGPETEKAKRGLVNLAGELGVT